MLGVIQPNSKVEFKLGLDGRPFWGHNQVMIGLSCISEGTHYKLQRSNRVFPLVIVNGKEEYNLLARVLKPITTSLKELQGVGVEAQGEKYTVHFKCN